MAGLPWMATFALLAWIGHRRGQHPALVGVWILCLGMGAGNTDIGQAIYHAATGVLSGLWAALVGLFNNLAAA